MPRPTITDVATAAGVSKGAVSFALNDKPGLAPDTRRRMLQVAEHGDEAAYRRLAKEGRVDGVLITDLHVDDRRPELMKELGLPFVMIGPRLDDRWGPALAVDDAPGVRAAVDHLVSLGHRRIAHVSGPQTMVHGRSRRIAWAQALSDAGVCGDDCLEADFSAESG